MSDYVNGTFELIGGLLCWLNVVRIARDKRVAGVWWPATAFFSLWGLWNLYYYPSLGQWASFTGGIVLVLGNTLWVVLACMFARAKPSKVEP